MSVIIDGRYAATSASQITSFRTCPRKWFNKSILKIEEPSTPAQAFGSAVHKSIENFLKEKSYPTDERLKLFVETAAPFLLTENYESEKYIELKTFLDGPLSRGYIDLLYSGILDYKTTSDFRYCKTPEELTNDVQMASYAKWFLDTYGEKSVEVSHLYLLTKNKKPKARLVSATITREQADLVWEKTLKTVKEMSDVVKELYDPNDPKKDRTEEITPNTNSCDLYPPKGCFFRSKCFDGIVEKFINITKKPDVKEEKMGTSLSEKLAAKKNDKTNSIVLTVDNSSAPVDMAHAGTVRFDGTPSIRPPDAPPDLVVEPLSVQLEREAKDPPKKGRPKKADAVKEVMRETEAVGGYNGEFKLADFSTENNKPKNPALNRKQLTLYIDCIPTKGPNKKEYVLLEDFIAPIAREVADANGVLDHRMISYTAKAALAAAIRTKLDDLPSCLVISSYAMGSDSTLEVLIPYATEVVKALRG